MPSLDSAYAQVDRGSEHLIELRQLHDEVCAVQAESTVVEFKLQATVPPGESVKAGEVRYPRPPVAIRIRIIAGETANCFRSALDYLVGQLAILDSGTRQEKTQFLITDTPDEFEERRGRSLKGVNGTHVAMIKKLQPHNGSDWLILLRMLSNFAKHDDLILLYHNVLITTHKYPVDPTDPDPFKHKMRVDFQPVIQIAINEGFPLIATLEMLKSQVAKVLDAFKPEFE